VFFEPMRYNINHVFVLSLAANETGFDYVSKNFQFPSNTFDLNIYSYFSRSPLELFEAHRYKLLSRLRFFKKTYVSENSLKRIKWLKHICGFESVMDCHKKKILKILLLWWKQIRHIWENIGAVCDIFTTLIKIGHVEPEFRQYFRTILKYVENNNIEFHKPFHFSPLLFDYYVHTSTTVFLLTFLKHKHCIPNFLHLKCGAILIIDKKPGDTWQQALVRYIQIQPYQIQMAKKNHQTYRIYFENKQKILVTTVRNNHSNTFSIIQ